MGNNTNDTKIIKLKEKIVEKKKDLEKVVRFIPTTNCSIEFEGVRYNIQVLTKQQLVGLLVKLNALALSAKDLDLESEFILSGYSVCDWMSDINSKLSVIKYREEESKLKELEIKLDKLLSNEKKTELEINEIESLLQ